MLLYLAGMADTWNTQGAHWVEDTAIITKSAVDQTKPMNSTSQHTSVNLIFCLSCFSSLSTPNNGQ